MDLEHGTVYPLDQATLITPEGTTSELKPKGKTFTYEEDRYRKELLALVENMECDDDLSPTSITSILKQGSKGYI